jgi:putative nucleotidyltransferase-like protein
VTGDPGAVTTALRRVAAFGLTEVPAGSHGGRSLASVPADGWGELCQAVVSQRLTGLAVAAADADEALAPDRRRELLLRHRLGMLGVLALEETLLGITSAFEAAGVAYLVLKGSAVAHACYPDPSWRPFHDVDLLVRTCDWRRACALLEQRGFHRRLPEPRPGFDERFGKAATHESAAGLQVDLHRRLVLGPFGLWMDAEELFDRSATFLLGGRVLRRAGDEDLLVHACMHASLGAHPPLLLPLRDVAQIAGRARLDWGVVQEAAARWKLGVVLEHAFAAAVDTLDVSLPEEARWLPVQVSPAERAALRACASGRRYRGGTALSTLRAIGGLRSKLAYAAALVWPSGQFLTERAGKACRAAAGGASRLHRLAVPLRWLGDGQRQDRATTRQLDTDTIADNDGGTTHAARQL